jgi:oligopeptide transport system substrate-binding protein
MLPARARRLLLVGLAAPPLALWAWASQRAQLPRADLTLINGAEVQSLDPAQVTGIPEGRVVRALFEGLTIKDPETLAPLPAAAERWEVSPDGLRYLFWLRPKARWSNGDPLRAADFVFAWQRLLEPRTAAEYAYQLWCVRGARAYSTERQSDGSPQQPFDSVGIRALGERELEVWLEHPTPYFLELCASTALLPVHPPSAQAAKQARDWLSPSTLVGNGPYCLSERRLNERIRLTKSPTYWGRDQIALASIDLLAVESSLTNLNLYLQGDAQWINLLPNGLIPRLLPREDFDPTPYFATYFYRVNVTRPPLDDPRVRRALALAIDRSAITEKITKSGQRPWGSLTAYGMPGYSAPSLDAQALSSPDPKAGFAADLKEARGLLEAAGYGPGGQPCPPIEILYNTNETHRDVAEVIAAGWRRDLGLPVQLLNQEWKVYLASQAGLDYDVARAIWIGDYLDPLTFLEIFKQGSKNNKTGWNDARYDALLDAAARSGDPAERAARCGEAEALLLEALPILPIYSYVSQTMIDPRLGGAPANLLDELQLRWLYWRSDAELAAWRERRPQHASGQSLVDPQGPPSGAYPPNAPAGRFPDGDPRWRLSPLRALSGN